MKTLFDYYEETSKILSVEENSDKKENAVRAIREHIKNRTKSRIQIYDLEVSLFNYGYFIKFDILWGNMVGKLFCSINEEELRFISASVTLQTYPNTIEDKLKVPEQTNEALLKMYKFGAELSKLSGENSKFIYDSIRENRHLFLEKDLVSSLTKLDDYFEILPKEEIKKFFQKASKEELKQLRESNVSNRVREAVAGTFLSIITDCPIKFKVLVNSELRPEQEHNSIKLEIAFINHEMLEHFQYLHLTFLVNNFLEPDKASISDISLDFQYCLNGQGHYDINAYLNDLEQYTDALRLVYNKIKEKETLEQLKAKLKEESVQKAIDDYKTYIKAMIYNCLDDIRVVVE